MTYSILLYLKEVLRPESIRLFFCAKTAPLILPKHFRNFPETTGRECTNCLACMMICPSDTAIEVLKIKGEWTPVIHKGHCVRCGFCVEACPENVLDCGRILVLQRRDRIAFYSEFFITIDPTLCKRCGNCSVACPVNKEIDPTLAGSGTPVSDEVIMKIIDGEMRVIHPEKCTGCSTCELTCANNAIRVARVVQAMQVPEELT